MKATLNFILFFVITITNMHGQVTWSPPGEIAGSGFGNDQPRIVMDASNNAMVIWSDNGDAMFSKWNGIGFNTPVAINPSSISVAGASWMGPNITSHGDTVYAVYKETPENVSTSGIWCSSSFDGGATFATPVRVDNIGSDVSRFPTVTTNNQGHPIVAFMRYTSTFANPEWVVSKSIDFGVSFAADVLASGWSAPGAEVCDCCPGVIASKGNNVAMLYRDNNSNIRDSWVGISTNNGTSFTGGMNVDQQNWLLLSCPSDGPDGIIIGDTVYSTFMNGNGGTYRTYFNKSSLSAMTGSAGIALTGTISGLTQQNYPHIDNSGNEVAVVWRQVRSGTIELAFKFTADITNGLPAAYDTIAQGNVTNTDLEIQNGSIMVVWQDNITGTIKYRMGSYTITGLQESDELLELILYPNPSSNEIILNYTQLEPKEIFILDVSGKLINKYNVSKKSIDISALSEGTYFLKVICKDKIITKKFVKNI